MLVIIKKWNLVLLTLIMLIVVCGAGLLVRPNNAVQVSAVPGFGKRIVLDAGHGEPDGGAVGSSGVMEKELNLKITKFLQAYLEQGGMEVVLTRADDSGIYDAGSHNIKQKKRTDIHNREKLMNHSDADLFVSIHMNKFTDARYSGPQVFYSANHAQSKLLAEEVQKAMISGLAPESAREVKKAGKEIYLLKQAKLPAILIECGFLSNSREEKLLLDEDYQKQVAWSIYCGIVQYFAAG